MWLSPNNNPARKLRWTWEIVLAGEFAVPVLVNTARPNAVVAEAFAAGEVPELQCRPLLAFQ